MVIGEPQLAATAARYADRSRERTRTKRALETHGILHADDHDRVVKRLKRLNASWALARSVEGGSALTSPDDRPIAPTEPALYGADVLGLERLMGHNDLIEVGFLERGAAAARPVGRINVEIPGGGGFGTGFLVTPDLLMTNNHVLGSPADAAESIVEFDFQEGRDGRLMTPQAFAFDPQRFFVTDKALDFSLVAVQPRGATGAELAAYGFLPLIEHEGKVILGELVNIIQHPNGEPKQLALRENKVVDLLDDFVHYETDTSPGSSGSPVFNDQWEVVALHHSGVPKTDKDGKLIALDGAEWTEARSDAELAWVANEGVRVSRILASLDAQDLTGPAAALRAQLVELARGPQSPPAALVATAAGFPGPISVTVSFGGPTVSSTAAPAPAPPAPAPPAPAPPALPPIEDDPEVRAALAEAAAGRARTYYDAAADKKARTAYYVAIDAKSKPPALYEALSKLVTDTHANTPRYQPATQVYPFVDLHPDKTLRSIYSGKAFPPEDLIKEDFRIERARRLELSTLEAAKPFNCEHVVPQSTFDAQEPMRGDIHHLFACESGCNSFRGNFPYFNFADFEEVVRTDCGKREDAGFEPSNGKGAIARATLYFLLRYRGKIGDRAVELQATQLPTLLAWHKAEPVGDWERHRNAAIAEVQGNRSPLIDHPEWADKVAFELGFGAPG